MKLRILSNFPLTDQHHGTVDRDQRDLFYDYRGKAQGCHNAALSLPPSLTLTVGNETTVLPFPPHVSVEHTLLGKEDLILNPEYEKALYTVHSHSHVERLQRISEGLAPGKVDQEFGREADVWCGTYQAAISSLIACLRCVDAVAAAKPTELRTFANVWPPGHHAEGKGADGSADLAMGFCYISNAAVAAFHARNLGMKTLVIDIDNHSGNGTRKALMNQAQLGVLDFVYVSPYDSNQGRYLDGFWDPTTNQQIGIAREFPYRHNEPLRGISSHPVYSASNILSLEFTGKVYQGDHKGLEPAASHDEICARYTNECLPWIREFNPDLIIWSVGLDSAADDPLGALGFLPKTFFDLIASTSHTAPHAKMVGIMEGGYKAENWTACLWPVLYGFGRL